MNTWVEKNEFVEQVEMLVQRFIEKDPRARDPRSLLKEISTPPAVTTPDVGIRSRQVMFQNEEFELVLMTWGVESASPIHGHGGSQCYMHVLSGELIETRYRPYGSTPLHAATLTTASVTHIHDEASFHKLSSVTGAVSLHLYARPLHSMQVFDETKNEWVNKGADESL